MADPHDATAHTLTTHTHTHAATTGQGAGDHHGEDHDHDGSPTQKLLAANSHESPSADTHHADIHADAKHTYPREGFNRLKSGLYYPTSGHTASNTPTLDELRLVLFPVAKTVTVDRIGVWCQAGLALSEFRLGIYRDDGNGYPGARVLDAGTVAMTSQGFKEITISQELTPDLYWIGGAGQVAVATMTMSTGSVAAVALAFPLMPLVSAPTAATSIGGGFVETGVSGALPANFTTTKANITALPRVFLRAA